MGDPPLSAGQTAELLDVSDPGMVLVAAQHARQAARCAGLDGAGADAAALAAAELAGNAQRHGQGGRMLLVPVAGRPALDVVALDRGPGMADWNRSATDGYTTVGRSLGGGLGAVDRAAAAFAGCSEVGRGTVVAARIGNRGEVDRIGAVGAPKRGQRVNGDAWVWTARGGDVTAVLADGLGSGPGAAAAGAGAVADPDELTGAEPEGSLTRIHARLRGSRGAAVTVVRLRSAGVAGAELDVCGAGNVAAVVVGPDGTVRPTLVGAGTAGLAIRRPVQTTTAVPEGGVVVLHTDGLVSSWTLRGRERVVRAAPVVIAGVLLRDFARGGDDTGIVVLRPSPRAERPG